MLKNILNKFKTIKINNKKYKIGDKVYFSKPLKHPDIDNKLIYNGTIEDFDKKINRIALYLADSISIKNVQISSFIKSYDLKDLEKMII